MLSVGVESAFKIKPSPTAVLLILTEVHSVK